MQVVEFNCVNTKKLNSLIFKTPPNPADSKIIKVTSCEIKYN